MPGLFSFSLVFIVLLLPCQSVPSIVNSRKGYISRAAVQKEIPAKFFKDIDQSIARRTYLAERQSSKKTYSTPEQPNENRPKPKGYNFDPCLYHRDCFGGRLCLRADFSGSCSGATSCTCMNDRIQICKIKCNECENYPEETCAYLAEDEKNGNSKGHCVSTYLVYEGIVVERGCNSFPDSTPLPAVEQSAYNWSLSGQSNTAPYSSGSGTDSASPSHPMSPPGSEDSEEKTPGDTNSNTVPYSSGSSPLTTEPVPPPSHSPSTSPSTSLPPQGSDDSKEMAAGHSGDGCIDVKALAHLPPSQLVYSRHVRRGVLCDAFGSCATPGHMVIHRGKAMSMRIYCASMQSGRCSKRVMDVNSPRYSRSLRLQSRTAHVEYTPFAAKYESGYEEHLLRLAIHIGL